MALKVGTEDKKKVIIVAVLAVVVLGLVIYNLSGLFAGGTTPAPAPAATTAPVATTTPAVQSPAQVRQQRVISPSHAGEATRLRGRWRASIRRCIRS